MTDFQHLLFNYVLADSPTSILQALDERAKTATGPRALVIVAELAVYKGLFRLNEEFVQRQRQLIAKVKEKSEVSQ